jgi:DNA-binding MarR family transcriptional regulator
MKTQSEQLEGPELKKAYEKLIVYSALDNRIRLKAFFLIARNPRISFNEIRTKLKIEKGHLAYHLGLLKASGLAIFTYERKGRITSRYDLTERGREMFKELTEEESRKKTGDQVMVLTDMKLYLDITLEIVREPIVSPYPISEFAIDVKGRNRQLVLCTVYCKGEQLFTIDPNGAPKYEVQLPLGGTLRFHIPDTLKPLRGSIVEVREGEITIYETFDVIPGATAAMSAFEP